MNLQKLSFLDNLFNDELNQKRILGASIQIEQHGKIEFSNCYGSDKKDTIYKIYSMTKPITAVAAMILYERGLIDLDDAVSNYLPAYKDMKVSARDENGKEILVDAERQIKIFDLLNMTSGLVYPGEWTRAEKDMTVIQDELRKQVASGKTLGNLYIINELAKAPLEFHPGKAWKYGISADVVAGIIEVVSGMTYGEFLQKEIFDPLEMIDTAFYVPSEKISRMANVYMRIDDKGTLALADKFNLEWMTIDKPDRKPNIESGGGGLYSTMEDYLHFVRMLINGGTYKGKSILGKKTVEYLARNSLTKEQQATMYFDSIYGYSYSTLMRTMVDLPRAMSNGSIGEFGWDGLAGTYFFVDPKEDLILVYMQEIAGGFNNTLRRKIRSIVYGSIE